MSAPVFVVPDLPAAEPGDRISVAGTEGRHAVRVRRLGVGEPVEVVDGRGRRLSGVVDEVPSRDALIVAVRSVAVEPAPQPRLVVVQALAKGDRGELAVETLTEVGADVIVPWAAARCVTVWREERVVRGLARWRATAREAAKQSRRSWVPEVADLTDTAAVAALIGAAQIGLVLHEAAALRMASMQLPDEGDVVMVVGPEGGIDPSELTAFQDAGALAVRLGPTVLRTSTAGAAAAAVVLARTGRWA